MVLFNKHLDRRTFLRGVGATVALPLLDAMIPARALLASIRPAQRLAFVYFPHGAVMSEWPGRILEPLAPFANRLTVVSGVENRCAYGPVHAITPGTWLSVGAASADQLATRSLGRDTLLPSINLAAEEPKKISAGIWEGQFDQNLATTISFGADHTPLRMECAPRAMFNTLFAAGAFSSARCQVPSARCRVPGAKDEVQGAATSPSVLDLVADDAARLRTRLGVADRRVLGDYLECVRHAERCVEKLESEPLAESEQQFIDRLSLMFDLTVLAFRADITRVASLMMAAETSSMTYGHVGVSESFHALSHHQNDPERLDKLVRIQTFHSRMLANFVRSLAELPDGDGSILDHSQILYGSNMSDSHAHDHFPLPVAVLGQSLVRGPQSAVSGARSGTGYRQVQVPDRTPMSKVLVTVLRRAGVPTSSVDDGSGHNLVSW